MIKNVNIISFPYVCVKKNDYINVRLTQKILHVYIIKNIQIDIQCYLQ